MSDGRTRPFRFSVQAFEAQSGAQWTELARRAEVSYINVAQRSMETFAPVVARLAGR